MSVGLFTDLKTPTAGVVAALHDVRSSIGNEVRSVGKEPLSKRVSVKNVRLAGMGIGSLHLATVQTLAK